MKKLLNERTIGRIFNFMAIIMFFLLFHYCLELTGENSGPSWDEHIYFKQESILLNALRIIASTVALYYFGKLSYFLKSKERRNILLTISCMISAAISFYWVLNSGTEPQGDQDIIVSCATFFSDGDFASIQRGGYVALYPQQLGIITFLRVLFFFFGSRNYVAFQLFVAALVPVIVYAGCMIVRELSEDNVKVELYYQLFAVTCFPMYAYTCFVYGDLVSISFALLAVWAFLSCMKRFRVWKLACLGLSAGITVMLRTNMIIVVIAMLIVALVKAVFGRSWRILLTGVTIAAGVLLFQLSIRGLYAAEWGDDADALPPLSYIVMGLNDEGSHPGWYNIYSLGLFAACDYDVDAANERALSEIWDYVEMYKNNPTYMYDFFTRKMNAQWNAPMYQCIVMNNNVTREQSGLISNIYAHGEIGKFLDKYTKLYQLLLYGSILFLLISKRKQWEQIEKYVLLIAVFGGFIFSLIWEAKTRYVFPYLLLMLPYGALGINEAVDKLQGILKSGKVEGKVVGKKRYLIGYAAILTLHIVLVIVFGIQKQGFHEDEYYSYSTSTGSVDLVPYGYRWRSGAELQSQFYVRPENRFAFDQVVENQARDVHPPLYYLCLNVFMSLFPGCFYKWFGILLNLFFSVITLFGIFYLFDRIDTGKSRYWFSLLAGAVYAVAPSTIGNVMLIRMYSLSAMWTVLYACILVELYRSRECSKKKFAALTLGGAMVCYLSFLTHYFCLLVAFFATLFYAVYVVTARRKDLKRLMIYGMSMTAAVGLAVLTFPTSLRHIFQGYRGTGAINGLLHGGVFDFTRVFLPYIDKDIFGGIMVPTALITLAALAALVVFYIRRDSREKVSFDLWGYVILLAAVLASGYILTKTSLMVGDVSMRFFFPVVTLLLPLMAYIVVKALNLLAGVQKEKLRSALKCAAVVLVFIPVLIGHVKNNVLFLYSDEAEKVFISQWFKESPCIVVFNRATEYRSWYTADQLWPFENILYVDYDQMTADMEEYGRMMVPEHEDILMNAEKVLIYMDGPEEVIKQIMENNTHLTKYSMIRHDPYFCLYLLE